MAENVQYNLEETLGELEQMENVGLFTNSEIRKITHKRKQLFYLLQRRTKSKDDYLKYIEYELNLLKLVKKRRDQHRIKSKKSDIDFSIASRINRTYKISSSRYQSDLNLWQSYIKFLEWMGWNDMVSKIYARMLQFHSDKPAIWIAAAKWELEVLNAAESARTLMLQALRFHPQSKELFLQYFDVELMYSDKIYKRRKVYNLIDMENDEDASDAIMQKKLAYAVFKNSMTIVMDVDFHLAFLPLCKKYDHTQELQDEIFKDIQDHYSTEESMWNYLSRSHLIESNKQLRKLSQDTNKPRDELLKKSYVDCFETFKTAVEVIPTENMWSFYISLCLDSLKPENVSALRRNVDSDLFKQEALEAMKEASSRQLLAEKFYLEWVMLLQEKEKTEGIRQVLLEATQNYSSSGILWKTRIENLIVNCASNVAVQRAFNDAISSVDDDGSLAIWTLAFQWTRMALPETLVKLFENSLTSTRNISSCFKPLYLDYVALNQGIVDARKLYQRLRFHHPIVKDFFYKMLSVETVQLASSIDHQRKIMEDLLEHFGQSEIKPWLDYIHLEKTHPDGRPMNVSKIHWRAIKCLDPSLEARFSTAYSLLATKEDLKQR